MSVNNPSTWPEYAKIDPELETLLNSMGPQPGIGDMPDVPTARKFFNEMVTQLFASGAIPMPDYAGVKKSTIEIPVRDGSKIRALLYQPENVPAEGSPLVFLIHGGGFCIGIPEMEENVALDCVKVHGAVALSVDYRMAPEHAFPGPTNDCWDALKWAASSAASLKANPSKGFVIGGTSAGGNLSLVLTHLSRDESLSPPLTGVWLNIPATIDSAAVPEKYKKLLTSYEQNKDAPALDVKAIDFFYKHYKPEASNPLHSPLLWPGGHKDLPPHFIQVCGLDPLRDDALIYNQELKEQGGKSKVIVYQGVPHGFEGFFHQLAQAKTFAKERAEGFAWLLKN